MSVWSIVNLIIFVIGAIAYLRIDKLFDWASDPEHPVLTAITHFVLGSLVVICLVAPIFFRVVDSR